MGFKLKWMWTNSADAVFVSSVCNVRFSKLFKIILNSYYKLNMVCGRIAIFTANN